MVSIFKRNLILYFRNKSLVIYSLLSVIIIIGIYAIFLKDLMVKGYNHIEGVELLINCWIMSGLLAVTPVTTALCSLQTQILDRYNKTYKDFVIAPISRVSLAGGYIMSTFVVSSIMTLINLLVAQIYLMSIGGNMLSFVQIVFIIGSILITSLTSTAILYCIVSSIKKLQVYSVINSIFSTLMGFLTGILIPICSLPSILKIVVKIFPFSHSALIYRNIMMESYINTSFNGAPLSVIDQFKIDMGITYNIGDIKLSMFESIAYLCIIAVIAFIISIIIMNRKSRENC